MTTFFSETWTKVEVLNLSSNELSALPPALTKLSNLRRLFVNNNKLDFEGVPSGIGKLSALEIFSAASNRLEMIPEGLCRINNPLGHFHLRQLPSLTNLTTLRMRNTQRNLANMPQSLSNLVLLSELDLSHNEFTKVPESLYTLVSLKRINLSNNKITELSNSIETWTKVEVLNLSSNELSALPPALTKLSNLRRLFVNNNKLDFEGVPSGIGTECRTIREEQGDESEEFLSLFNTGISYIEGGRTASGFFTVEDTVYTTRLYRVHAPLHQAQASSIHLEPVPVIEYTLCGSLKKLILSSNRLITLPDTIHLSELQVLDLKDNPDLIMPPKPQVAQKGSFVFLLDAGLKLFIWNGPKAKNTFKSKTRLLAEKINKNERKNKAEILTEQYNGESSEFWALLGEPEGAKPEDPIIEHVANDWVQPSPRLY
ncbi:protein flightless-1 homolog, partial [Diaphorina citri]|uniref:Protein flightless-1 homolog n=1 Tax=Diaphorina citri TaxID=121845 RepID=A0A3Q0JH96_DIACI